MSMTEIALAVACFALGFSVASLIHTWLRSR